jgi:hypothetical protein
MREEIAAIIAALAHRSFRARDEYELQDAVASCLVDAGIDLAREVVLDGAGRIDFLTHAGVGIELKVDGSPASVLRQLHRYSHAPGVTALVLITTRAQHRRLQAAPLRCPLHVHHLSGLA